MSNNLTNKLYPEIEPFDKGWLKVDEIHQMYYEQCGNANGTPVVFLHGGPGSGCNPAQRRFFDPQHYRIILLDQRGCGRSKPEGEIRNNTTQHLVADIEQLRIRLGITQWHVFGGSWGSTLALAYALAHTAQVKSLTLRGIFLSRQFELDWFLGQIKLFFPEPWQTLCNYLPETQRNNPLQAFQELIFSEDTSISIPAAIAWNAYESSIMSLLAKPASTTEVNGAVELARARVQIHYIKHFCFICHTDVLAEAKYKLPHIPTVIVQGRYDMVCPPLSAWQLANAMPHAKTIIVPDAGHSAMELGTCNALVEATDDFKHLP